MSDVRLRELERRFKESGSLEDEAAWLLERVRVGRLDPTKLELAAHVGHPAAARACERELEVLDSSRLEQVLRGLRPWGDECTARAACAAGWAVCSLIAEEQGPDEGPVDYLIPRLALRAFEDWILCPCETHERHTKSAGARGYRLLMKDVSWEEGDPRSLAAYCVIYAVRCTTVESSIACTGPDGNLTTILRLASEAGATGLAASVQRDLIQWALGADPIKARVKARKPSVVVLEDSPERVVAILRALGGDFTLQHYVDADHLVTWASLGADAALISLDYHLGARIHGTGLTAATALAQCTPTAPVILHSSDSTGARAQEEILAAAGWQTERLPFNEYSWAAALARWIPPS